MLRFLVAFFWTLWQSDDRPEARKFTIGCFLLMIVIVGAIFYLFSQPASP